MKIEKQKLLVRRSQSKICHLFVALFSALMIISCSSWLDLEPYDGVMEDNFWRTKEDVNSFVVGCYTSLTDNSLMDRIIIWGELRADFLSVGSTINTSILNIVRGEISPENEWVKWDRFYWTINQCNKLIERAPAVRELDRTLTKSLLDQYVAEATAVRSLMYFYLVRSFQDVPFVLKATDSDAQDFYPEKTAGKIILDSLVVHMTKAIEHLPTHSKEMNRGRMTRYAAMALLADIYLWQSNYEGCIGLCNQIINSGQYTLIPVSRSEVQIKDANDQVIAIAYYPNDSEADYLFDQLYVAGNSIESIFEVQYPNYDPSLGDPFFGWFNNNGRPRLWANTANLNDVIFPSFILDRDVVDIRGNNFSYKSGNRYIWKYTGLHRTENMMRGQRYFPNWIFYRLSDAKLMKAEALTQLAIKNFDDQKMLWEAYSEVDQIRVRANAVPLETSFVQNNISGLELERLILEERAREFAYEGKRWYDLLRHARRGDYKNINYLMNMAVYSAVPPDKLVSLQTKYRNTWFHYWPIYYIDVETNPKLKQNDFYLDFKR